MNNPIKFIDPDGRAPDYIYDQQEDGSYQRREGVENDGGENFHTYHNNDGTVSYYNQKENTFTTVDQNEINEGVEDLGSEKAHQVGLTGAAGAPLGLTVSGGIAWDSKGNVNPYGNFGFFHGVEITAGIEYTQSKSKESDFSIYSLEGTGVNYNGGLFFLDAGFGSNTQGNGNYNEDKKATYQSFSGGLSVGIPVGASRSVEQTKVFRLFGND